ncbi:MAG: N-acyl-D-amino-acid deacylase family protein [Sphingobium sp.]
MTRSKPGKGLRAGLPAMLLLAAAWPAIAAPERGETIVIRGGTIYDGSSATPVTGDVVIRGDRIVSVGPAGKARVRDARVIDATGMIVAPGFIDTHTHSDRFLMGDTPELRLNLPWMMQGVTTIFTGSDGNGQPGGTVDVGGLLSHVESAGHGLNVAAYVGFGAVRQAVLKSDARAPDDAELARMKAMVAKGMCEGALGLSTGLFYAPQSFAKTEEVIAVTREAAVRGGFYDTHQRDESSDSIGLLNSVQEVIRIGRETGIPVHFSHFKAAGPGVHGKSVDMIAAVEAARAEGINVTADQYPWAASQTSLAALLVPRWAVAGGMDAFRKRLDDPALAAKIRQDMAASLKLRGGPSTMLLPSKNKPWTGKRLAEIAGEWNVDPIEAALRVILDPDGANSAISFGMHNDDITRLMKQPWVMTGSDGSQGHPRMYATYPEKYARYVLAEKAITLADFINSSSGRVADTFRLDRRGHLRAGNFADIVVFDPAAYRPRADYVNADRLSEGVRTLLVNGVLAIDGGKPTGAAAGRALRKTPPAGTCP